MSNDAQLRKSRTIFGIGGAIALLIIVIFIVSIVRDKPAQQSAVAVTLPEVTVAPAITTHKLGDKVAVGKFEVNVVGAKTASEIKNAKTEEQFVTVQLAVKNNDEKARDVSANMFQLVDGAGKSYEAYDKIVGDEFLFYETINPGLTRERSIAFETPKGISGLKLVVDSGVALAGGEKVTIELGQ